MDRDLAVGRIYRYYTGEYYIVESYENGLVSYTNLRTRITLTEPIESFLGKKVPANVDTNQEYQFERADIIHRNSGSGADQLEMAVKENDGYCPCKITKDKNTLCMCREFRETIGDAVCHCGLYTKIWVGDQK